MSESTAKRQRTCSTEKDLTALAHGSKRICVPIDRAEYARIVWKPQAFRQWLDALIAQYPELFPAAMAQGYQLHDILPVSKKLPDVRLRRITVADPATAGRQRLYDCARLRVALYDRLHRRGGARLVSARQVWGALLGADARLRP